MKHLKHIREEENNSDNPQLLAVRFLDGLTKGKYEAVPPPSLNEPISDSSCKFNEEIEVNIKWTDYSMMIKFYWEYSVEESYCGLYKTDCLIRKRFCLS